MLTHRLCGGIPTLLLMVVCLLPVQGIAHPMGNFSINHFSALDIFPHTIRVTYILDMAEIPTFQEMQESGLAAQTDDPSVDLYRERKVQEWQRGLVLRMGETLLLLRPRSSALTFPLGAGGLPTLRLVVVYEAPLETTEGTLVYEDMNYPHRAGWKEIVAQAHDEALLQRSSVPVESRSQQLTDYATDLLQAPPQDVRAELTFSILAAAQTQTLPVPQARGDATIAAHAQTPRSWLTELITVQQLTPGLVILSLFMAMGFGALHALEPGHGKTLVAAYLVGERGTAWHALILGLTVTASHTIGVFALGAVALFASHYIVPEQLYPWLSLISGLLIVGMGGVLLRQACLRSLGLALYQHHSHDHSHPRNHEHHHNDYPEDHSHQNEHRSLHQHPQHSHYTEGHVSYGTLLTLGITGGMIPCPGALVVLLSAVALQRITFGLLLIVAFSMGLAAVLVGVGLLLVSTQQVVQRWGGEGWWATYVPFLTPLVMTPIGVLLVVRALLDTGLFPLKPF